MMIARHSPPLTPAWSACRNCGLLQQLPLPAKRHRRICSRCSTSFGSGVISPYAAFAFALTALMLFILTQSYPIMNMEMQGRSHSAHIATAVSGLATHDFPFLATLVFTVAIAAPLLRMLAMAWVLSSLHVNYRPAYLTRLFSLSEDLRNWAMLDVCLLGAIVAFSKLHDLAHVDIGIGFWALGLVVLALVALEAAFDRQVIWDMLYPPATFGHAPPDPESWISCHHCDLLQQTEAPNALQRYHCKRCSRVLHHRKPDSINRTLALAIAGFILYIPANLYPVMTVISFGKEDPSTIMGGVQQLLTGKDWPLAFIVFTASIVIPLLKLLGILWLMITVRCGSHKHLADRTRLYRIIESIGRWSNIDIFVAALLTGLVTLGNIATVEPGNGAIAFGAVVILTMFAAQAFDPRLMWDAAGQNHAT